MFEILTQKLWKKTLRIKSLLLEMSRIVGDTELFSPQSLFLPKLLSQDIWIIFHS